MHKTIKQVKKGKLGKKGRTTKKGSGGNKMRDKKGGEIQMQKECLGNDIWGWWKNADPSNS